MASRRYVALSSGCLVKVMDLLCRPCCKFIDCVKMCVCYEIYGCIVNIGRNRLA